MRQLVLLSAALFLTLSGCSKETPSLKSYESTFATESFVRKHLLTKEGLIRTNISDRQHEFLSESIGLYLLFLVDQKREDEFANQIDIFKHYFLDESNLVSWRLEQTGDDITASPVNAWIDDARIIHALSKAADVFNEPTYTKLAEKISTALTTKGVKDGLPVDYVDLTTNETGDVLTLSYLDEAALRYMPSSNNLYLNSKQLLEEAPLQGPFFAKSYSISDQKYHFDDEINMIDQLYVAIRYEQFNLNTDVFYDFFKEQFNQGLVYGRYDLDSKEPAVNYESQAVYALAIFYLLERDEKEFAETIMKHLKTFMISDSSSEYYGGYIDVSNKETHSFDNLLPLLAEGGLLDGYLIP
ncbi:hypothetical protein [Exiguobacterium sp. HVEsp1]|uniref:hypothetical protein n=1 Tax=Exiguobacterium sp. HVEsp1 TaxID=1934003 RepID=UPI0009912CF7|nr:hypothetical protein [Exiguobacterium sp. HVEsp1]